MTKRTSSRRNSKSGNHRAASRPNQPTVGHFRAPGLPCPDCKTPIVVEAIQLLTNAAISCSACGLKLQLDRQKSAQTLELLEAYMLDFSDAQDQAMQAINTGSDKQVSSNARSRRPRKRHLASQSSGA